VVWDSYAGYIDPDYCRDTDTLPDAFVGAGPTHTGRDRHDLLSRVATLVAYMIMEVLRIHRLRSDSERST
jgi:hypothetical protein